MDLSQILGPASGQIAFSTSSVPPARRLTRFREAVCDSFFDVGLSALEDGLYHGEMRTRRSVLGNFSMVQASATRLVRSPSHIRPASEESAVILHQLRGKGYIAQGETMAEIGPGDIVCYVSSRPYELVERSDFCVATLMVPLDMMLRRMGCASWNSAHVIRGETPMGSLASSFFHNVASEIESVDSAAADNLFDISFDLVTAAVRALQRSGGVTEGARGRSLLVRRAKSYIDQCLHDPELNTARVASELGVSNRYLQFLFQQENTTVNAWIWERRLDRASHDLIDPRRRKETISSIAFAWGFNDCAHFSHRFKARYKLSPRAFRASGGQ